MSLKKMYYIWFYKATRYKIPVKNTKLKRSHKIILFIVIFNINTYLSIIILKRDKA